MMTRIVIDDSLMHDGDDDSREAEYIVCDNLFNIPPDRFCT